MTDKILFVDDDIHLLEALQRAFRREFNVETAVGGSEGLTKLAASGPFALVVADMQMPGMSGLEFLRQVQVVAPDTVRMMLTGNADQKTAVDAVNDGRVFRFLNKPCPATALAPMLKAGLEQFRLLHLERDLLKNTLGGALNVLTEILSTIDPATFERGQRLRENCHDFSKATGLPITWETDIAAMLLSIGRVTIPISVLEKVRQRLPLVPEEADLLEQVPEFGARLLEKIPRLENVVAMVRHQQKHFDGSGFPGGSLTGAEIPFGSRLLKFLGDLADMEAEGLSKRNAWEKMQTLAGWYDPEILLAASIWCDVAPAESSAEQPPLEVDIEDLKAGHILNQDVVSTEGLFLLAAGTKLTGILVSKLQNFRRLQTVGRTLLVRES